MRTSVEKTRCTCDRIIFHIHVNRVGQIVQRFFSGSINANKPERIEHSTLFKWTEKRMQTLPHSVLEFSPRFLFTQQRCAFSLCKNSFRCYRCNPIPFCSEQQQLGGFSTTEEQKFLIVRQTAIIQFYEIGTLCW